MKLMWQKYLNIFMPFLMFNRLNGIAVIIFSLILLVACDSIDYDYKATNYDELLLVLEKIEKGEKIYLPEDVTMNLSGRPPLEIPAGITLFSLPANKQSKKSGEAGAYLYSKSLETMPMIKIMGENVTLSGLRIVGPDSKRRTDMLKTLKAKGKYYLLSVSQGVSTSYDGLVIINSELSGWSYAAIHLANSLGHKINNNYIHHNQRWGLGYGVVLDGAEATIEHNRFDWNRHAIAGSGREGTEYVARYNVIGKNGNGHAFDMHGKSDLQAKDGTVVMAGKKVVITNNIFLLKQFPAIAIRGIPKNKSVIKNNCFSHVSLEKAVRIKYVSTNISVIENTLSEECL